DPKNHERAAASTWESVLGGSGWRGRSIRRGRSSTWTFGAGSGLFVVSRMVSSWRVAAPEPLARAGGFVFFFGIHLFRSFRFRFSLGTTARFRVGGTPGRHTSQWRPVTSRWQLHQGAFIPTPPSGTGWPARPSRHGSP